MNKCEVIIIRYGLPEMEDACIESVKKNTRDYELTVYDNFKEKENLGKLWNRLIGQSRCEYICLLNSDTLVTPDWLYNLLEVFEKEFRVGVVGPTTNHSHNEQSMHPTADRYTVVDFARYKGTISGFCMVFPKAIWEKVGGFPEDFGFY